MEDHRRPVALEDLPHRRCVAGVGEHGCGRVETALVDELALDLEEAGLTVVDEQSRVGRMRAICRTARSRSTRPLPSREQYVKAA